MREQLAEVWRVFRRQRAAAGGFLALAVIVVASPSIVVLSRIDPEAISADVLGRPSLAHAMGTDYLGRDILGRVLHGHGNNGRDGAVAAEWLVRQLSRSGRVGSFGCRGDGRGRCRHRSQGGTRPGSCYGQSSRHASAQLGLRARAMAIWMPMAGTASEADHHS